MEARPVRPGVEQLASAVAPAHDRRDSPGRYNKLTSTLRLQQDLRVATWITRQGPAGASLRIGRRDLSR